MRFTLISPRLAIQKWDLVGSGVLYWPVELAVLAAFLRERGEEVTLLDLLGASPRELEERPDHYLQGCPLSRLREAPAVTGADAFILFALSSMSHEDLLATVRALRAWRPQARIAVLENAQAVTAYALTPLAHEFFASGADILIGGEPYAGWEQIRALLAGGDLAAAPANLLVRGGPADRRLRRDHRRLARYPVPAWDLFDLESYWSLPYAHGPKTGRYLPILSSRGCPFSCDFCVLPETGGRRWRARDPEDVVAEMIELRDRFGVRDFQVEDVNPTVNPAHWEAISRSLLAREAGVRFYFVSGTKAETVHLDQVALLARAGCRYLSISPESGSPAVLRAIGKRFDHDHGLALVVECKRHQIMTQACFIVGHPAETARDHQLSCDYLRSLVQAGLDEVAVFVVAPLPGSAIADNRRIAMSCAESLVSFSPRGRADWALSAARRRELVGIYLRGRLARGAEGWRQGARALFGVPRTKLENLPRRMVAIGGMILEHRFRAYRGQPPATGPRGAERVVDE